MMYYHEGNGMDDTALAGWVASSLAYLTGTCTDLPWRDATSERTGTMGETTAVTRQVAMSRHEWTALTMVDFGFNLPEFDDVTPGLAERGWLRSYGDRWQVTGAGRRAMRGLPPEQPVRYGCDGGKHAGTEAAGCRWPVHCGFCGKGLDRWYYGMRAPMCPWCHEKSGPVLSPASWEMATERVGPEARRVWESWATLAEAFPASGEETVR